MQRLNKYITDAGYCSRREADAYIEQGRVTINGREASLGDLVGEGDCVEVDGERVGHKRRPAVYIACNKPVGVTCTSERSDPTNIVDFIGYKERIFPVGRLDKDSEGLILLTSDGDIVNKILRAGNNNPKEYVVTVDRPMTGEFLARMASGVNILGVKTKPCKIVRRSETTFVVYLTQGLNRQIRRMCQALGYKVVKLKRTKVMNIALGNLEAGRWRYLTADEAREMHALLAHASGTEEASDERKAARKPRPSARRPMPDAAAAGSGRHAGTAARSAAKPGAGRPAAKPAAARSAAKPAKPGAASSAAKPAGSGAARPQAKPAGKASRPASRPRKK